jgi:hypothetical protein
MRCSPAVLAREFKRGYCVVRPINIHLQLVHYVSNVDAPVKALGTIYRDHPNPPCWLEISQIDKYLKQPLNATKRTEDKATLLRLAVWNLDRAVFSSLEQQTDGFK